MSTNANKQMKRETKMNVFKTEVLFERALIVIENASEVRLLNA